MDHSNKTIIYFGNFLFPEDGAAAKRVLNIGRALRMSGYNVIFAGNNEKCRDEDKSNDGTYIYDGFIYYARSIEGIIKRRIDIYNSFNRVKNTIEHVKSEGMDVVAVIGYHMDFLGMIRSVKYCKRNKIKFISDCTEWYDPCQINHGRFGPSYYSSQLRMLIANKKSDGLIAISKYLENYYSKYTKVIRIPPLDDVLKYDNRIEKNFDKATFVYCGTPGGKDDLTTVWKAFESIGCKENWELHIVGISEDYHMFNISEYSPETVKRFIFHGRLPLAKAQAIIKNSHFSIVIRPENKRFTKAGFPTKFSESFSLGTPVITNLTSDIEEYILDRYNGIIVENSTKEAVAKALKASLSLNEIDIKLMSKNCYSCAFEKFDYRVYANQIYNFIKGGV